MKRAIELLVSDFGLPFLQDRNSILNAISLKKHLCVNFFLRKNYFNLFRRRPRLLESSPQRWWNRSVNQPWEWKTGNWNQVSLA